MKKLSKISLLLLSFVLLFIAKKAHKYFDKVFKTYDKLNNVVQENLRGIRVVKAFVREETEDDKFDRVSHIIYEKRIKIAYYVGGTALGLSIINYILYFCRLCARYTHAHNARKQCNTLKNKQNTI